MLLEEAANLREGFFFGVVVAEPLLFFPREALERGLKSASEERDVSLAMGISEGRVRGGSREGSCCLRIVVAQFLEAAAGADSIDVALGQNRSQPSLKRTAPVKVTEERSLRALATIEAVEIGKKRIGEIARFR